MVQICLILFEFGAAVCVLCGFDLVLAVVLFICLVLASMLLLG